jgi:hypothetical protein
VKDRAASETSDQAPDLAGREAAIRSGTNDALASLNGLGLPAGEPLIHAHDLPALRDVSALAGLDHAQMLQL